MIVSRPNDSAPDLFRRPVARLAEELQRDLLSARGLTEHFLDRIAKFNPTLNAFTYVGKEARAFADASDHRRRAGRSLGALDGIPVAIKDNLWVEGMPATWGSPLFRDHIAPHDETAVAKLRSCGAILLGKTNCPEFAMRGVTVNPIYGATANPWDISKTPGGSSGGAVAAVAAGLVPLSLATDGGGSIRRPAAYTNLTGFKPSVGRVRRGGGFIETMFDCEVIGPIARDVTSLRLLFDAIAAPAHQPIVVGRRRILFVETIGGAPVDPEVQVRCRAAVAQLMALGHVVTAGDLPFDIAPAMAAWSALGALGLARIAAQRPRFLDCVAQDFIEQALAAQAMTSAQEVEHIQCLLAFRGRVASAFSNLDIIMTPSVAAPAWPLNQNYPTVIAGQTVGPRGHAIFTGWVNAAACPAIALPAGLDKDGVPVGFQLVGAVGVDDLLFDLATEYENAHPWADRRPLAFA